jgi:hypothetical protein
LPFWFCIHLPSLFLSCFAGQTDLSIRYAQYTGMAKEQNDFRASEHVELIGQILLLEECQHISWALNTHTII